MFLLPLEDFLYDGIEAAMAFGGAPIGIGEGLTEEGRFWRGRYRVSGCPGLENALRAVEMVLVPLTCLLLSYTQVPQGFSR